MNFNLKNTKYAIAIFAVFAISGLLYTSSALQYGFAQSNSSSGGGSAAQSSSGGSSTGEQQKNDIGSASQLHNLTGAGTEKILSNNTSISSSSLSKIGNESKTPPPSEGKPAPKSQSFPTQSQAAGQGGNQSLTGQNAGQSQSSGGQSQGNQSSSSGGQSQGNQSSSSGGQSQGNQSGNPLGFLTNL
ncbi:MAG: hypothetical protein ACTHLL_08645 [Candidatus Nitrosocosmicus sp.]